VSDEKPGGSASELNDLYPGVDVQVILRGKGAEKVRVEPLYALQFTAAIAKIKPLAKAISRVASVETTPKGEQIIRMRVEGDFSEFFEAVVASAEDGMSALIDLLAVALRKPREWFEDVSLDGLFDLSLAAFEQNRDFFVRRIQPMLKAWMPERAVGAPSSPASSEQATAEATSTT
jgi:hypothetical protein